MITGVIQAFIEPFNGKNWSLWFQHLVSYFMTNDVSNEKKNKRTFHLTLCGANTFEFSYALVAPNTPEEFCYADIATHIRKHFDL
ncbi:hypothetical protein MRX96_021215 [Rhipicephalus microplus]